MDVIDFVSVRGLDGSPRSCLQLVLRPLRFMKTGIGFLSMCDITIVGGGGGLRPGSTACAMGKKRKKY
ncbi:hypothetical protein OUZ56_009681 [Daphnia magna]|uniref:Uncharacterized protein n=1 Tax=Daphnia magna TaxID=35525 RepID=A0ABR0AH52_9CRUS|nr:hypothetical protein OUZ56_009681 [Daphnia magna]